MSKERWNLMTHRYVEKEEKKRKLKILLSPVQVSYMISAWARMCKIIGQGFVQYLPVVMGPLIQAASLKPEIAFLDCELELSVCSKTDNITMTS